MAISLTAVIGNLRIAVRGETRAPNYRSAANHIATLADQNAERPITNQLDGNNAACPAFLQVSVPQNQFCEM